MYFGERVAAGYDELNREPFTTDSHAHVSVWQKPEL